VARVVRENHDSCSLVFEVPPSLAERFRYRAGQFLSFKIPYQGKVLTRSYSLSSSPDCDPEHKVTVKRIEDGRVSNWINDEVKPGDTLMVVPPSGLFVLNDKKRKIVLFAGGSGITPCISIIKTALRATTRKLELVYANRDERSIIFADELEELERQHPDRLEIVHSLDDRDGYLDVKRVEHRAVDSLEADFYLCGPAAFMDTVERALAALHVPSEQIHIERFISPPDPDEAARARAEAAAAEEEGEVTPCRAARGARRAVLVRRGLLFLLHGQAHPRQGQDGRQRLPHARSSRRGMGADVPVASGEPQGRDRVSGLTEGPMSRRDQIRMTDDELRRFLGLHKTMTICSIGPDGYPHPMPMWFAVDEDGAVRMTTFRKSQKVKNIQRDPRVSLLVEAGEDYTELRGVVLYGKCEIIDDIERVKDTLMQISGREVPDDPGAQEAARDVIGGTASKRVVLVIRPERIVSWDHRKLGGSY
jgi:3-ketosteroid 9alpha-monooxygenase subunit B